MGKLGKLGYIMVTTSKVPAMTTILRATTFYDITNVYTICISQTPLFRQILGPLILVSIVTSLVTGQNSNLDVCHNFNMFPFDQC